MAVYSWMLIWNANSNEVIAITNSTKWQPTVLVSNNKKTTYLVLPLRPEVGITAKSSKNELLWQLQFECSILLEGLSSIWYAYVIIIYDIVYIYMICIYYTLIWVGRVELRQISSYISIYTCIYIMYCICICIIMNIRREMGSKNNVYIRAPIYTSGRFRTSTRVSSGFILFRHILYVIRHILFQENWEFHWWIWSKFYWRLWLWIKQFSKLTKLTWRGFFLI